MTDYTLTIKDLTGATIASDVPIETLEFGENLNSPGVCNFRVPLMASYATDANLAPIKRTIELYRAGSLKMAGPIWSVSADVDGQTVDVSAAGWYSILRRRIITDTLYYVSVEMLNIAWNLINNTQGEPHGNLDITRWGGETASGIDRKRLWCCYEGTVVADAIEELAFDYNGFDFEVTPGKVWKAYFPLKGGASATTFSTGAAPTDTTNVFSMNVTQDGSGLTTQARVVPDSDICNDIRIWESSNISDYKLFQSSMPAESKVKTAADRETQAKEYIRNWRVPRWTVDIQTDVLPFGGNYDTGDTVAVDADAGYATFNRDFRVVAWKVTSDQGQELATVSLDSIIDDTI